MANLKIKKKICPLKFESDSEESAKAQCINLIRAGESRQRTGYVTRKFVLMKKEYDGSKRQIKEYQPPF